MITSFSHRNAETLIHLLKGSLGTGILAMPNAFFKAGLVIGFVGTIFIGSLCTYCIHVLVSTIGNRTTAIFKYSAVVKQTYEMGWTDLTGGASGSSTRMIAK